MAEDESLGLEVEEYIILEENELSEFVHEFCDVIEDPILLG